MNPPSFAGPLSRRCCRSLPGGPPRKCSHWPAPNSARGRDTDRFGPPPLGLDHQQFSIPTEQNRVSGTQPCDALPGSRPAGQTSPSLSTSRPCGPMNIPPAGLLATLPFGSSLQMVSRFRSCRTRGSRYRNGRRFPSVPGLSRNTSRANHPGACATTPDNDSSPRQRSLKR
jgi:hypothetical protein